MQRFAFTLALWIFTSEFQTAADARNPVLGVKLCGREFIRAVIFTCGGSRWKRSRTNAADIPEPITHLEQTMNDANLNDWDIAEDVTNYQPESWGVPVGLGRESGSRRSISDDALEAVRSSGRKGRDVVVGLSNACCKWGCTKSEISSLC
ncbi:relaxin-3-like [Scyliorhinus torazame]|uniref:relaxin-3-like n=1 Tax=Scyliorhinus torazame TaxID=75743 RepID=UPI003B5C1FDF